MGLVRCVVHGPTGTGISLYGHRPSGVFKKADTLWWETTSCLYDTTARLFYRDSRFFDKREATASMFSGRGAMAG